MFKSPATPNAKAEFTNAKRSVTPLTLAIYSILNENNSMFGIWETIIDPFIKSNVFLALATYVAGYIAFRVYKNQKQDEKRNAANVIVLEIERAEKELKGLTTENPIPLEARAQTILMPTDSWAKYKHLFIADFIGHETEWNKITDFYSLCAQYDESVEKNAKVIDRNTLEITVNYQRILADHAKAHGLERVHGENPESEARYWEERQKISETITGSADYTADIKQYTPMKFTNRARSVLESIDRNISTSSSGQHLKSIAKTSTNFLIKSRSN